MKKSIVLFILLLASAFPAAAQGPLYIVNGTPQAEIASIPPERIESVEMLPADEETIARYGPGAAHGVVVVTLSHDRDAEFTGGMPFGNYIASRVVWPTDEPAARVVLRYTITPEGMLAVDKVLESTDARLRRRVLKAVAEAPGWQPATKNGQPVESQGILRVELPAGKPMPRKTELVLR